MTKHLCLLLTAVILTSAVNFNTSYCMEDKNELQLEYTNKLQTTLDSSLDSQMDSQMDSKLDLKVELKKNT